MIEWGRSGRPGKSLALGASPATEPLPSFRVRSAMRPKYASFVHVGMATVVWFGVFAMIDWVRPRAGLSGDSRPEPCCHVADPGLTTPPPASSTHRSPLSIADVRKAEHVVATSSDVEQIMDAVEDVWEGSVCTLGEEGSWSRVGMLLSRNRNVMRYRIEQACPEIEMKDGSSFTGFLYNMQPRCADSRSRSS